MVGAISRSGLEQQIVQLPGMSRSARAIGGDRLPEHARATNRMKIEAARRGDHAAANADRPYDSVLLDRDAGDAARTAFNLLDRCT